MGNRVVENRVYQHVLHSRSLGYWLALVGGVIIFIVGVVMFVMGDRLSAIFPIVLGLIILYGVIDSLIKKYKWMLVVTDKQITWNGPKLNGSVKMSEIKSVHIETGDGALLKIQLVNGSKIDLPRCFYGNEKQLADSIKQVSKDITVTTM